MKWSLTPKKLHVSDMICLTKPLYQDQNEAIILEKKLSPEWDDKVDGGIQIQ